MGKIMGQMRLQKFLAHAGIASRRASEDLIRQGRITVNGKTVTDMGLNVDENDVVAMDGKFISNKETDTKIYIVVNKPVGYVSTAKDQFGRPAVVDLVSGIKTRLYPVGRLDFDTSGLIILTNDGEFTYRMTHPKHEIDKVYEAVVSGIPSKEEIERFENGLKIEDYTTSKARLEVITKKAHNAVIHVTIHEGKNRQVRKMCDAIGHRVLSLKRISIGPIALGSLPEGKWRSLTSEEIEHLC